MDIMEVKNNELISQISWEKNKTLIFTVTGIVGGYLLGKYLPIP